MPRTVEHLSPTALGSKGQGLHADGRGLYFQVKGRGRSWIFRYRLNGRSRYMGLGPYPDVSLAQARREAEQCRQQLREGIDPIEARRRRAAHLDAARSISFRQCADRYVDAHRPAWRNAKHAKQWSSSSSSAAGRSRRGIGERGAGAARQSDTGRHGHGGHSRIA